MLKVMQYIAHIDFSIVPTSVEKYLFNCENIDSHNKISYDVLAYIHPK